MAASPLEFFPPDRDVFPALGLAFEALELGGTAPAHLNAANEVAVGAFLDGKIGFLRIAGVAGDVMRGLPAGAADSLDSILSADRAAREAALKIL